MSISFLGGAGMGLVWGWLLILMGTGYGTSRRPLRNALPLSAATILFALQLRWFTDITTLLLFLVATAFSGILHIAWRHSLRNN